MIQTKHQSPVANGCARRVSGAGRLIVVATVALAAGGCVQTKTSNVTAPPPAVAAPLVLNSGKADRLPVAGTAANPGEPAPAAPAPAPAPEVATAPAPVPAVPATPPASPPTVATATEPLPTSVPAPPVPKKAADGYPNINAPPDQPEGALLSAEERQRVIAELEALRDRQKEAAGGEEGGTEPAGAVAKAGATHGAAAIKQIEECSDEKIAAADPDCKAPGDAPAAD